MHVWNYASTQICKYAYMFKYDRMHVCKNANMQVVKYTHMKVYKYIIMQVLMYGIEQICKYASMHVYNYKSMQVYLSIFGKNKDPIGKSSLTRFMRQNWDQFSQKCLILDHTSRNKT